MRRPSPNANLAELLAQWSTWYGWNDRPAFLTGDDAYTHGEVHTGGARLAGLLRGRGVRAGDRVLITLSGSIEFVWAFLGTVRLGAVAVLAGPGLTATDYAVAVHETDPAVTVCESDAGWRFADPVTAGDLIHGLPAAAPTAAHPVAGGATAYLHRGSTGQLVSHRHRDPESRYVVTGVDGLGLREDGVLLSTTPVHSSFGLDNAVFFALFAGATSVLCPASAAVADIVELVRRHRPSLLFGAPSLFGGLIAGADRSAFGSLRAAVCDSGTLPAVAAADISEWLGCPVVGESDLGGSEVLAGAWPNTLRSSPTSTPVQVRASAAGAHSG